MWKINEQICALQNIISRESMNAKTATASMHRSVYQGGFNQQSESTESHSALGRNQLAQTTTFLPDINQSNSQRAVKMGGVGAVSGPVAKGKTFIIRGKDGQPSMRTVQLTQVHAHHIPRDASSVNFRQNPHTMKDNSSISRFGGVGISGGPSSDHSSSSPQSTKFTNKEYRNARTFNNLYDLNLNPKYRDMKEKERLGIRRVQCDRLLPPLEGIESSLPSIQDQQVTLQKMILRNNDGQVNIKQQVQEENAIYSPSAIHTPKN
ncbi:hypothetical protein FGO68_gene6775 [Halteria grandinella]|uniref:Uncharacterized protein n=1 Tax=Halteria grandinella TaxID=5974 RepID=A0A8J8P0H2_HALGN|nr:hypothetical protein FGO68_gene6775 [Halteria grandinella]